MNLRDLLNLGKTPIKPRKASEKSPAPAPGKGTRGGNAPATTQEQEARAREQAADRAIQKALEQDAKTEPPRKP